MHCEGTNMPKKETTLEEAIEKARVFLKQAEEALTLSGVALKRSEAILARYLPEADSKASSPGPPPAAGTGT
jgi:hypothetical protein